MRTPVVHTSCLLLACLLQMSSCRDASPKQKKPNFLLIMADDMAYSDLGCYGSEISTPHLDRLAREGILFTQFHAAPQCAPSRAMLICGSDNHMAGVGRQDVPKESKWYGKRGYERNLSDRIIPFPELLQQAGYFTCMSGKWHLGYDSTSWPDQKGFDRSFGQLNGGSNHFIGLGLGVEGHDTVAEWVHDGQRVDYPDGRYSTELHTDNLIEYLQENQRSGNRPFFAYAAYSSPHWPLQVPDDWLHRYAGQYEDGYEELKANRFAALKSLGFIPQHLELPDYHIPITPWDSLDAAAQRRSARKMELYAAMLSNLDHHIGRLRSALEEMDKWEDTYVFFLSDNGAAHRDFFHHPTRGQFIRSRYDNSLENMGTATSFVSYGPAWAQSCMVPYKHHKTSTAEGGMIVAALMAGPEIPATSVNQHYISIMDLAPTFLALAQIDYQELYAQRSVPPMKGSSLTPLLSRPEASLHGEEDVFALEFNGSIFLQKGPWKLVNYRKPYRASGFELYHLGEDPAEQIDLKLTEPAVFASLLEEWKVYQKENHILLQTDEEAKRFNY